MFRNLQKQKKNIEHVGWDQEGFRTSFRANASGCVGSKPSFTIPWGNLNQVCSKQTSSTGTLGSTPERTQLVVLARNSFSTKHQFKHTSLQKDQLCADTIVCVLNKTWTRSKLQKVFPQRWPKNAALSECRHYFLPLAAR